MSPRKPAARKGYVIAIDGPAGVGKSTIGTNVARELGYRFINTGEMYRALTWRALEDGVDVRDAKALTRLAEGIAWDFRAIDEDGVIIRTWMDGHPVTHQIREERVGMNSSTVAGVPGVRKKLRALQRALGEKGSIVMEGRDITTVVFPDADFKVYLDASVDERARRRTKQLRAAGKPADLEKIRESIVKRDMQDLQRRINPLRQADDAVVIDSTELTMAEVSARILSLVKERERGGK